MASSRRSPPPDKRVADAIAEAIAAAKFAVPHAGPLRMAVALSGGRDSMALLDALAFAAPSHGVALSALHVDHGLSPHAGAWSAFCAAECAKRGVPLTVRRVAVSRASRSGLEAAARAARYRVFDAADADVVALAHHADDQAETLLLQLVRGAGPQGLAAMPMLRARGGAPALLRPLLALPRRAIDAYVRARGIAFVDDESNADAALRRNFLRHDLLPRLAAVFPGCPATLVRAARHQAEAALLCDELAAIDAGDALADDADNGETLDRRLFAALAARAPHRARNVLRWFLRRHALRAPSAARLSSMQRQLASAAGDARVRLVHDGVEVGVHRGRIVVHAAPVAAYALPWHGEPTLALPHGILEFAPAEGSGLALSALERGPIVVRPRGGGERIRLAKNRPRQTLKRLLQSAGVPAWQRDALPLVWCGDALAAVPGVGVDVAFAACGGAAGRELRWRAGTASVSHSHRPLD